MTAIVRAPRVVPPFLDRRTRLFRALGVALLWIVGIAPALLGRPGCPMAEMFGIPCPGCGMTRAALLLLDGQLSASLSMHPLAVPCGVASLAFMLATVWVTARRGSVTEMWNDPLGRTTIIVFVAVQGAMFLLWAGRWLGLFGGPVPV